MSRGICFVTSAFALVFALPATAHVRSGAWHEHMWPVGDGHAFSMPFIGLALLVGLLAIAFIVGRRARDRNASEERAPGPRRPDPQGELALRFARGEIDEEEFERRRRSLAD